jgi:hypothetical protein
VDAVWGWVLLAVAVTILVLLCVSARLQRRRGGSMTLEEAHKQNVEKGDEGGTGMTGF